jgi:ABC-type branched-subunit amino acid transport system substrate-binding protein
VKFMVAGLLPQEITAVLAYTTAAKVLTIVGQGSTTVVGPKYPYEFQYDLPYTTYAAAAAAAFKLRHLSVTKVGVIDASTASPTAVFAAYNRLSNFGIQVVDTETFATTATTLTPQLSKMQAAGAQVIITAAPGATLGTLFKGISALHITLPVLGSVATTTSTPLTTLIPSAYQAQFFATTYSVLAHPTGGLSPAMTKWVTEVQKYGPVTSLLVACNAADQLKLAVWAYNKAGFKATGAKAAKELEKTSKVTFPKGYFFNVSNPKWTASNHSDTTADTSKSWGMITVGPNVDGTYPGVPLTLAKATK